MDKEVERPPVATSPTVDNKSNKHKVPEPMQRGGLLHELAYTCQVAIHDAPTLELIFHVYDNMNSVFTVAEQILKQKNLQ